MVMDDGELDFSNQEMFSYPNIGDPPNSCSTDSFFAELLNDTHACTHTHTCNPPGPDSSHTHTCFHVHTKILPADEESSDKSSKKRPLGNREAVRKYREKKKAMTASLEDEVVSLRTLNQQLLKKLQNQAFLEAEVARLKCLLVDIRGRIEGEMGSFPYQKPGHLDLSSAYVMNPCNMGRGDQALFDQGFDGCEFENVQCMGNRNLRLKERSDGGLNNIGNTSRGKKRKGTVCAATTAS